MKFMHYCCVLQVLLHEIHALLLCAVGVIAWCFCVGQKSLWVLNVSTVQFLALLWKSMASLEEKVSVSVRESMKSPMEVLGTLCGDM